MPKKSKIPTTAAVSKTNRTPALTLLVAVSPLLRQRFHTLSYYANQTGGEVSAVSNPQEFAGAVDRIISGLAARYSLGFTLEESERNDDRVHTLEVKVKPQGPTRNLVVSARSSYIPIAQK